MITYQTIRVRVPEGRVVPNLDTGAPCITRDEAGEDVRYTRFVERRIADGDLIQLGEVVEHVVEEEAAPAAEGDV